MKKSFQYIPYVLRIHHRILRNPIYGSVIFTLCGIICLIYVFMGENVNVWYWSVLNVLAGTQSILRTHSGIKVSKYSHASVVLAPQEGLGRKALARSCYKYANYTATNICCLLHSYSSKDIHSCAAAIAKSGDMKNSSRLSIVIIGDSRARQIFNSLSHLLRDTNMTYFYDDKTGKNKELIPRLFDIHFHTNIRLDGIEVPLTVTFYWDPYLNVWLPKMLKQWLADPETQPHLLQIEAGVHYLAYRKEKGFEQFEKLWKDLLPNLTAVANTTHTVVKMIDHVLVKYHKPSMAPQLIDENINRMNLILLSSIHEHPNRIIFWNSSSTLSDQYVDQCYKNQTTTTDSLWKCTDPMHLGYVVIHQLRDMMLNSFCNRYIDLDDHFCK